MDKIEVKTSRFKDCFAEAAKDYNDETLDFFLDLAQNYISSHNCGGLRDESREYAIYLMCAHLLTLKDEIRSGKNQVGKVISTTIDKVSVSLAMPKTSDSFEYWLSLTVYGDMLMGLLRSKASAGFYVSGSLQRVLR